jgi:CHAT domain-containing protein
MLKNKLLIITLSLSSLLIGLFFSPSFAQTSKGTAGFLSGAGNTTSSNSNFSVPSKGTAGFLSGAGNTTSSNSNFSVPSFENQSDLIIKMLPLGEETETQKKVRNIIQSPLSIFYLEKFLNNKFETYLALPGSPEITIKETQSLLQKMSEITGKNQAILYIFFNTSPSRISQLNFPQFDSNFTPKITALQNNLPLVNFAKQGETDTIKEIKPLLSSLEQLNNPALQAKSTDELQLLMITSQGVIPVKTITGATRRELIKATRIFEQNLTNQSQKEVYLPQAKQLYQWIISPIEQQLKEQNIENVTFILDDGLRTLPIAALYNEKTNKYVIEDYSVGLMPSLYLTDLTPRPRRDILNTKVLAMGAETFTDQKPLPAVPVELSEITQNILTGNAFLNQDFTVDNLKKSLVSQEFNIVHLATHGEFQPGDRSNSFIYFSDQKLTLDQFSQLGLDNPKIDLLVLSACRTAFGDPDSELGFAGLAIKTGARTALGSLWNVSDEGTLALMTMFYDKLKTTPMKAESLRQAQLALLKGNVTIQNNELILDNNLKVKLSPTLAKFFKTNKDLRNPYYWSAFTLIGNPW